MNGGERTPGAEQDPEQQLDDVLQRVDDVLSRAMPGLQPETELRPEEHEGERERPSPQIYVASLSDYNAGRLHGRWIDAAQPLADIWSDIGDMLAESPEHGAEEWAIHDYEGFWPVELHEYESLEFVQEVATGIVQDGEAFAAFVEVAERDPERFAFFEDMYKGKWESVEDYARSVMEQEGVAVILEQLPAWVFPHVSIDYEALVEDMRAGGVMSSDASEGGVHVFDFE